MLCQVATTRPAPGHRAAPGPACQARRLRPAPTNKLWRAGAIAGFGDAPSLGSPGPGAPDLVGIAVSPTRRGYWAVASSGAVFAYGDARILGSVEHYLGARPVAGIAASPTGRGYWVVSRHGGVFSFGDAAYYGSLGKTRLHAPVVAMAPTPDGHGYWLVTADGGVFSFGNAHFYGSRSPRHLGAPVVGMAPTPSGHGYWLATASGHVYSFGSARYYGSLLSPHTALSAIAAATGGHGYWLLATNGTVHGFGTAAHFGSARPAPGVTASTLAATGDGAGYLLATTRLRPGQVLLSPSVQKPGARAPASVALQPRPLKLLGNFLVTCYDLTGVTASGAMAGPQRVAVDPSVIPMGTQIYVAGIGARTADDTGGAIVGNHVDIWEPTYYDCAAWGAQIRSVYRVGP